MTEATISAISPCFIVTDVDRTAAFYCNRLGFEATFQEPREHPFFAVIRRGGAQLLVKSERDVTPVPNSKRHPWMRWDAFIYASDPDALAAEFDERGARLRDAVKDTHDGLRGFELEDPDGYVLFFGHPKAQE